MPTVFAQIDVTLGGSSLPVQLAGQVEKLVTAASKLKDLQSDPVDAISGLLGSLGDIDLPGIDIAGSLTPALSSAGEAMPSEGGSLLGNTGPAFEMLGTAISDIVPLIERIVNGIRGLHRLATFGFTAEGSAGGSSPSPSGGGGSPGGGGGGGSPPAPAPAPAPAPSPAPAPGSGGGTPPVLTPQQERRMAAINKVNGGLGRLPRPFTAPACVQLLNDQLGGIKRDQIKVRKLPFYDDLKELLDGAIRLRALDAAGWQAHLDTSLEQLSLFLQNTGRFPVVQMNQSLDAVFSPIDANQIHTSLTALKDTLTTLSAEVRDTNLSGSMGAIDTANSALDILLPQITTMNDSICKGPLDNLARQFGRLDADMDRHMRRIQQALAGGQPLKMFAGFQRILEEAAAEFDPAPVADELKNVFDAVIKALDSLDDSVVGQVIQAPTDAVNTAAQVIDNMLTEAAAQTGRLFDEVIRILDEVDVAAAMKVVEDAFADFNLLISAKFAELFAPVRQVIEDGVDALSDAADAFDPQEIIAAFGQLIDELKALLDQPEIKNALETIKSTVDSVTSSLNAVSFSPVTDGVVDELDGITTTLEAIDPDTLSTETKLALTAAVAILPGDLSPVTDPVAAELGDLIEAGPKPFMDLLKAKSAEFMGQIDRFDPVKLIGGELSKPFQSLITEMDNFQPSSLLSPLEQGLEQFRNLLKEKTDLDPLLKPVEEGFNKITGALDALDPAAWLKPLDDTIQGLITRLLDVLPTDEIFALLDEVMGAINHVTGVADAFKNSLQSILDIINGLENSELQLRDWMQVSLDRINGISDFSSLGSRFTQVEQAVEALKSSALRALLDTQLVPARAKLTTLDAGAVLTSLTQAYNGISRPAVVALPDSAEKTALLALLDRFNPLGVDFSRPFTKLQNLQTVMNEQVGKLDTWFGRWDTRFHGAGSELAALAVIDTSPAGVKAMLSEALERDLIKPLGGFLDVLHHMSTVVTVPLEKVTQFITDFKQKVDDIISGPGALGGLKTALQTLMDRLKGINFQFIAEQMEAVFDNVKTKMEVFSPVRIKEQLETAINNAIDQIDLSQILPQAQIDAIDAVYQELVDKLKLLDPGKIVQQAVQPLYNEKLKPIIRSFDLSLVMETVTERLDNLDEELKDEFDRVNDSYKRMLDAVPTFSMADALGAVGGAIGGSLGF